MNNDWDLEDNSMAVAQTDQRRRSADFYENLRRQRLIDEAARTERRRLQGNFIPHSLTTDELVDNFASCAHDRISGAEIYENSQGISYPWNANKIYIICHDCGGISHKLTDDISELQKCPGYNCTSRNITILRAAEVSLAIRDSSYGVNMTEVYNARRERFREQRAQRVAERRNS